MVFAFDPRKLVDAEKKKKQEEEEEGKHLLHTPRGPDAFALPHQ